MLLSSIVSIYSRVHGDRRWEVDDKCSVGHELFNKKNDLTLETRLPRLTSTTAFIAHKVSHERPILYRLQNSK